MQTINVLEANIRIDQFLMKELDYSRSKIQKMISNGLIKVNDESTKNSYNLKAGDIITINDEINDELLAVPEKMDLNIVYEDDDVIVVNKPKGMVVHPAAGNFHGTLVNGLLYYANRLSSKNGLFRPGIVHRIDADTSGLLMVAKNDKAHELLAKQLEEKTTKRVYQALVWGVIPHDTGTIDAPIGRDPMDRKKMAIVASGKHAVTHFKVLKRLNGATLIECQLETGRTHQIRVHMQYIGYPIVNDPVYGKRKKFDNTGQCLHAKMLGFTHPTTGKELVFDSELPLEFINIMAHFED